MAQPYVGEIRLFAGNFAPAGWWFCDGTLLPISENETLFQLIGTTYGGDGQSTFSLPDLRGRVPVHGGTSGYILAETFGAEEVTLSSSQIPAHDHQVLLSTQPATSSSPANLAHAQAEEPLYVPAGTGAPIDLAPSAAVGGSQPHDNRQPYLGINYIISLFGIFPFP